MPGSRQLASVALLAGAAAGNAFASAQVVAPSVRPAPGWYVLATPHPQGPSPPSVMAATIPIRRDPGGAAAVPPHRTLEALPRNGIIVQAGIYGRQRLAHHPSRRLPLTIRGARIRRGFEGVPKRYAYTVIPARVNGWTVEVYVWFGRARPTKAQLDRADAEVGRLIIPAR